MDHPIELLGQAWIFVPNFLLFYLTNVDFLHHNCRNLHGVFPVDLSSEKRHPPNMQTTQIYISV